ncbi:hypothetical protein QQZ08_002452 [Neonectria magnoliae]|uniref:Uncharacterized protein n=1 Tax=Neonectria magnoliae TaxID=2732573 RepID=A0ABR1ID60_9HYPO
MPSERGPRSQDGKRSDRSPEDKALQTDQDDLLAAIGGWSWDDARQAQTDAAEGGGEDKRTVTTPQEGVVAEAA